MGWEACLLKGNGHGHVAPTGRASDSLIDPEEFSSINLNIFLSIRLRSPGPPVGRVSKSCYVVGRATATTYSLMFSPPPIEKIKSHGKVHSTAET